MYLVKTQLGRSSIQGIGLFASEMIKEGVLVYIKTEWDPEFKPEELDNIPQKARDLILYHGFFDEKSGLYMIDVDNGRFVNHSDNPNVVVHRNRITDGMYAVRDILPGEEITVNYRSFDGMVHDEKRRLGTMYRSFLD